MFFKFLYAAKVSIFSEITKFFINNLLTIVVFQVFLINIQCWGLNTLTGFYKNT